MKAVLKAFAGKGILLPNKFMATIAAIMFFTIMLVSCSKEKSPTPVTPPPTAGEVNAKLLVNSGDYWKVSVHGYSNSTTKVDTIYALDVSDKNTKYVYTSDGKYTVTNVDLLESGTWKFSDDGKTLTLTIGYSVDSEAPAAWKYTVTAISKSSLSLLIAGSFNQDTYDGAGNLVKTHRYTYSMQTFTR